MSAPVYVGKHDAETRTEWLSVDQVWPVLEVSSLHVSRSGAVRLRGTTSRAWTATTPAGGAG